MRDAQTGRMTTIDHVGQRFGRLEVVSALPRDMWRRHNADWACECDCGNFSIVRGDVLRDGGSKSCGCLLKEVGERTVTHGHSRAGSRTYVSWQAMKNRCYNRNADNYGDYGWRGITVCDEWRNSFETFLADMGERPEGKSIDRIDVNGDYEPSNCRWATQSEQNSNQRKRFEFAK